MDFAIEALKELSKTLSTKTEVGLVANQLINYVQKNDYHTFLEDYHEYKASQIKTDEFRQMKINVDSILKNISTFAKKEEIN